MKVPAQVIVVALALFAWFTEVASAENEPIGLPQPLTVQQLVAIKDFNRLNKTHAARKSNPLRIVKRVYVGTRLLNEKEWGDVHKETFENLESKTKIIIEDRKGDLIDLLVSTIVYDVYLAPEGTLLKQNELRKPVLQAFPGAQAQGAGFLVISANILRLDKGEYRIDYPDFEELDQALKNLAVDVRAESYAKTKGEIPKGFVHSDHQAALRTYHQYLARTSAPTTMRVVWFHQTYWTKLKEPEWGSIQKEVLDELEKRWKGIGEKRQNELETLLVNRVILRCIESVDPADLTSITNYTKTMITDLGALQLTAVIVRRKDDFTYYYPTIDERLDAYLVEQAARTGTEKRGAGATDTTLPDNKEVATDAK